MSHPINRIFLNLKLYIEDDNIKKLINKYSNKIINKYIHDGMLDTSVEFSGNSNRGDTIVRYSDGQSLLYSFEADILQKDMDKYYILLIKAIDDSVLSMDEIESFRFLKKVKQDIKYLRNQPFFNEYPKQLKIFEKLDEYLSNKFNINSTEIIRSGYFSIKSKYRAPDIKIIYYFLVDNNYINGNHLSHEEFYDVFFSSNPKKPIEFKCFTYEAICILENMSLLFDDLTRRKIEDSKRFYTKNTKNKESKIITVNIYNRNLSIARSDKISLKKINTFFKELVED